MLPLLAMNSPNSQWKPGDKIPSPVDEMISIDPANIEPKDAYRLLIGAITPRPIAVVSTLSAGGIGNVAPFSFFNGVTSDPPIVMFSIAGNTETKKDTLRNIEETKEFVINSANEWYIEAVVHTGANYEFEKSEMEAAGLTPIASKSVKPPRIKEAAVQMECTVHQLIPIKGKFTSTTLVLGQVVLFHVFKEAYKDGKIAFDKIKNVGRLGGIGYVSVDNCFDLEVPKIG